MNTVDFSTFKFRASGIKNLMVNSRSKSDPLSETTKAYLQEIWIDQVLGRKKVVSTPPMQKGTIVESDSLDLVQKVQGKTYFKNSEELQNEWVKGTPDVIDQVDGCVKDIKSPWDLWTYIKVNPATAKKDYYYQVLTYMWLTGMKKGCLVYALVNAPENLIYEEYSKLSWKMDSSEAEKLVRNNLTFDDIPAEMRIKQYEFEYSEQDVFEMKEKIDLARKYLQTLSL